MPTLNWLGREKMTNDLRQVALRILREDPALSHRAAGCVGEMPHAERRVGEMSYAENAARAGA